MLLRCGGRDLRTDSLVGPMKKRKTPKFTGDLAEPITGAYSDDEIRDYWADRLPLLFEHYGIEFDSGAGAWVKLALRLARDHVDGFRVRSRGAGAPAKWRGENGRRLVAEVDRLRESEAIGVERAIERLKATSPAKYGKFNATRYYEVKKRIAFGEMVRRDLAKFL
jgi:hypothetical protein